MLFRSCATLPLLATMSSVSLLATTLFVFGVALGSTDCVMNVQAVIVERASGKPMMSGFHGFYSGPAGIGFIAQHSSLSAAFFLVAALMVAVAASSSMLRL